MTSAICMRDPLTCSVVLDAFCSWAYILLVSNSYNGDTTLCMCCLYIAIHTIHNNEDNLSNGNNESHLFRRPRCLLQLLVHLGQLPLHALDQQRRLLQLRDPFLHPPARLADLPLLRAVQPLVAPHERQERLRGDVGRPTEPGRRGFRENPTERTEFSMHEQRSWVHQVRRRWRCLKWFCLKYRKYRQGLFLVTYSVAGESSATEAMNS